MNFFKKIFGKVKEVINKVFKPKNSVKKEVDKIVEAVSTPATSAPNGWNEEDFKAAMQRAIDAGENFNGAEDSLIDGDAFKYPRVNSWLENNGYYVSESESDGGLE